jgi:hypothetical protein
MKVSESLIRRFLLVDYRVGGEFGGEVGVPGRILSAGARMQYVCATQIEFGDVTLVQADVLIAVDAKGCIPGFSGGVGFPVNLDGIVIGKIARDLEVDRAIDMARPGRRPQIPAPASVGSWRWSRIRRYRVRASYFRWNPLLCRQCYLRTGEQEGWEQSRGQGDSMFVHDRFLLFKVLGAHERVARC